MLGKRIPSYYLLLAFAGGCLLAGFGFTRGTSAPVTAEPQAAQQKPASTPPCGYRTMRIRGYAGISPLLMAEKECESPRLAGIRSGVADLVRGYQEQGVLTTASVYLRDLERGDWMVYNDAERYSPGSLLKVPAAMAYMRAAEIDPKVLKARYTLPQENFELPVPYFPAKHTIVRGREYGVPELIHQSLAGSDNLAHLVLMMHLNRPVFERLFSDLSLPQMDLSSSAYPMTAREYSIFLKTLFDASYLNMRDSEFAVAQLADCDFDPGIRAGVPADVRMAHKFGESGTGNEERQLHESAIVYLKGSPYLLTVMTKGTKMEPLPDVLRSISDLVYRNMAAH